MTQQTIMTSRTHVGSAGAYLFGAFALSWTAWAFAVASDQDQARSALVTLGGFGPMVAALVVAGRGGGRRAVGELFGLYRHRRGSARAYLVAAVIGAAAVLTAVITLAVGGTADTSALLGALPALPVTIVAIALVGGGNEEIGWRGFLLPRLRSAHSPAAARLSVGLIWAIWHAPLWAVSGTAQQSIPFVWFTVSAVAVSVLLGWATERSGGGILPAVLGHTALNLGLALLQATFGSVPLVVLALLLAAAAVPVAARR